MVPREVSEEVVHGGSGRTGTPGDVDHGEAGGDGQIDAAAGLEEVVHGGGGRTGAPEAA